MPIDIINRECGKRLDIIGIKLKIPGVLVIDSPGHEAFTTLRKRGGAISDIAILIVDINEGFKPQTEESVNYLKQFKTPFVVAATKIDRVPGWVISPNACFMNTYNEQPERAQDDLEEKIYKIVGELGQRGFQAERFDRVKDFTKQVGIVPVSGVTGEGVPDLLMMIAGIAQRYLHDRLEIVPGEGKGTVLEVKDYKGLGTTIDVVIYDGEINKGDYLVIGGEKTIVTRVKALLEPAPLKELRMEKDFVSRDSVSAAAGVKISAPDLENVVAGSPLRAVKNQRDLDRAKQEVTKEISEVVIETDKDGVVLKADTLGSLEALIKTLRDKGIQIRKARVGNVTKSDVMELRSLEDPIMFAFGLKPSQEMLKLADDNNIKIFHSDVIYRLIEDHQEWEQQKKERKEQMLLDKTTRPGRIRVLPGCVFRQSKPAVFGAEVLKGTVKPGYTLKNKNNKDKEIGEIKEVQSEGDSVTEAKMGDRIAISMPGVIVGKHFNEGDELDIKLTKTDKENLEKIRSKLRPDELELLEEE